MASIAMPRPGCPRPAMIAAALCAAAPIIACSDRIVYILEPRDGGSSASDADDVDRAPVVCPTELVGFATVQVADGDGGLGPATVGGGDGPVMLASTESEIEALGKMPGPLVIQLHGMIPVSGQADIVAGFKTIEPDGPGSGLMGGGLRVKGASNVIIRNLTVVNAYNTDSITLETADHVLVDHCDLYSQPVSSTDTFDDLIDIVHGSDWVTVAWTKFHDHNHDVSVVGNSDSTGSEDMNKLHVTFHHNLFSKTLSHNPALRFGTVHAYSNYYFMIADIGIASRMLGTSLVEENYFDGVGRPLLTSFDSPMDGFMETVGNVIINSGAVPALQTTNVTVPYPYTFTEAKDVPDLVKACAGPRFP
jgi:pectate lyase